MADDRDGPIQPIDEDPLERVKALEPMEYEEVLAEPPPPDTRDPNSAPTPKEWKAARDFMSLRATQAADSLTNLEERLANIQGVTADAKRETERYLEPLRRHSSGQLNKYGEPLNDPAWPRTLRDISKMNEEFLSEMQGNLERIKAMKALFHRDG